MENGHSDPGGQVQGVCPGRRSHATKVDRLRALWRQADGGPRGGSGVALLCLVLLMLCADWSGGSNCWTRSTMQENRSMQRSAGFAGRPRCLLPDPQLLLPASRVLFPRRERRCCGTGPRGRDRSRAAGKRCRDLEFCVAAASDARYRRVGGHGSRTSGELKRDAATIGEHWEALAGCQYDRVKEDRAHGRQAEGFFLLPFTCKDVSAAPLRHEMPVFIKNHMEIRPREKLPGPG